MHINPHMSTTIGKMNRNAVALGVVLAFLCILNPVKSHKTPQYSIKVSPNRSGRTLLHTLPVQTELQHLHSTLGAMANADGRRADLLLHKVRLLHLALFNEIVNDDMY